MKYLLLTGIYPPDIGGPATYIPKIASRLMEQGNQVTIITLANEPTILNEDSGMSVLKVDRNKNKIMRTIQVSLLIRKVAKKSDYIFANGLFIETALATFRLKKIKVAKIVGDPVWERSKNKSKTKLGLINYSLSEIRGSERFLRIIYTSAFNSFSKITAPGQELAEAILNWGVTKRVAVIQNGTKVVQPENVAKNFDLVTVTRLVPWKNVDLLISAASQTNQSLCVVGDGPLRKSLESQAAQLNANVTFVGQVDAETVQTIINESRIFILASNYEGLSFALLEAMMLGKVIIVSPSRGNTDVITHDENGLVLADISGPALISALNRLLQSPQLCEKLSSCAISAARTKYNEEIQIDKMIRYISEDPS